MAVVASDTPSSRVPINMNAVQMCTDSSPCARGRQLQDSSGSEFRG